MGMVARSLVLVALLSHTCAQSSQQRQRVYATDEIKNQLEKHGLTLVPPQPKLPKFQPGPDKWVPLSAQDFAREKLGVDMSTSCFKQGEPLAWTSENGEVLMNGKRVYIKGINWYGMETDILMPQGLHAWNIRTFMDFLATHRFNSIRLPLSLQWVLTDPNTQPNQNLLLPELRGLTLGALFDEILDAAASHGVLVLLDMHVLRVSEGLQGLWYDEDANEDAVLDGWEALLRRVAGRWNVFAVDIKNEPHGRATWGAGDAITDWNSFCERFIQRMAKNVPQYTGLFFAEGIEDPMHPNPYPSWWGGNLQGLRTRPIRTGSDHMDRRVVFSPHIYGPEVFEHAYFEDPAFPENLFAIWDAQFGFVESVSGRAMVIGEWGGSISGDNEKAALTQQKLAEWLVSRCAPDQYWWCLNPATSHNGGMLGDNYASVDMNVLTLLDYVQPHPTMFHLRDGGVLCVEEGVYANPRCTIRAGRSLNGTQIAPHKP